MKYTQKDICRILRIKRETLRHYEKEGIILPEIDPVNQYRYYDDYQVYLISECKRYQANEFSLSEIKEMMREDSLHAYISRMEKKQKDFEQKRDFYQKVTAFNEDYIMRLKLIPELLNHPFEGYVERIHFVPEKENDRLMLSEENIHANQLFREELSFSFLMAYFEDYQKNSYMWGFGKRISEEAEASDIDLLSSRAVMCVIDIEEKWKFDNSCAELSIRYAQENNLHVQGTFYMLQLVKTNEGGRTHRYMETVLPVEE